MITLTLAPVSFSKSGARRWSGSAICGPVKVSDIDGDALERLVLPPSAADTKQRRPGRQAHDSGARKSVHVSLPVPFCVRRAERYDSAGGPHNGE